MSKTPYEVRLELLKLANEILLNPVINQRDAKLQEWHAKQGGEPNSVVPLPVLPDFPTTTDVIVKATELRAFVDQQ